MDIQQLVEEVRSRIAAYENESQAYARQIERGVDLFENSRAEGFSDGAAEALSEVLDQLEELIDVEQSHNEWGAGRPDCVLVESGSD